MKAITYIKQNLSHLNPQILDQLLENEGSILTEELWAYLSETSWNTNPAILWSEFGIDVDENGEGKSRPIDWYIWLEDHNNNTHVRLDHETINKNYPVGNYFIKTDMETGESRTIFIKELPTEENYIITVTATDNQDIYKAEVSFNNNTWTITGANGYFPNPELGELIYYGTDNFNEGYASDNFDEVFRNACDPISYSENPIYLVFNGIVMKSEPTSEQSVEFNNDNEQYSISREVDAETGDSWMIMRLPGKCAIYGRGSRK